MSNRRAETRAGQGWLNEERPDRGFTLRIPSPPSSSVPQGPGFARLDGWEGKELEEIDRGNCYFGS